MVFFIIIFFCLPDMTKAKISLRLLGVHQENTTEFAEIKNLILDHTFSYCKERDNIPPYIVDLIEKHHNQTHPFQDSVTKATLSDIYAIDGENWNASCQPNSNLPNSKFEELYYSDEALIISYLSGGIGVSNFYEFYEINSDTLSLVGRTNGPIVSDIFFYSILLKYEEDMVVQSKQDSPLLQNNE